MSKKWRHLIIFHDYGEADPNNIEQFEKKYYVCLPKSYKELMLRYNGGSFEEDQFDFTNKKGQEDGRTIFFKSFREDKDGAELIEDAQFVSKPDYYGVPGLIGIGSTAEGDTLCFDYRDNPKTSEPKVILLVHDEYEETNGVEHMKIEPIANSFNEFLDMLYEYKDEEE